MELWNWLLKICYSQVLIWNMWKILNWNTEKCAMITFHYLSLSYSSFRSIVSSFGKENRNVIFTFFYQLLIVPLCMIIRFNATGANMHQVPMLTKIYCIEMVKAKILFVKLSNKTKYFEHNSPLSFLAVLDQIHPPLAGMVMLGTCQQSLASFWDCLHPCLEELGM